MLSVEKQFAELKREAKKSALLTLRLKETRDLLEEKRQELREAQKERDASEVTIKSQRRKADKLELENADLQDTLEKVEGDLESKRKELDSMRAELIATSDKLAQLKRDSQTNAELEARIAEIDSLKEEIKLLKKSHGLAEDALKEKEMELARLEKVVTEREEAARRDEYVVQRLSGCDCA